MANEKNLKPNSERTPKERKELARKAGKASAKARQERKTIAEGLKLLLQEDAGQGMTKQEAILVKVIKRLFDEGDIKDLKTLSEILGETKESSTTIPIINVITQEKGLVDKL